MPSDSCFGTNVLMLCLSFKAVVLRVIRICHFIFSRSLLPLLSVFQYWRQVYLVMVLAMTLAEFFAQIHPLYLTKKWQKLRSAIFCSVVAYGLIPTIHWIWLSGGFSSEVVQVHVNGSSSGALIKWIKVALHGSHLLKQKS